MTAPVWIRPLAVVAVVVPALVAAHLHVGAYASSIFGISVAGGFVVWWRHRWGAAHGSAVAWQIGVTAVLLAHGWERWATGGVTRVAASQPSLFAPSPAEVERAWFHAFPLAVTVMALLGAVALQQRDPFGTFLTGATFSISIVLSVVAVAMVAFVERFETTAGAITALPLLAVATLAVWRLVARDSGEATV